jgi:hypothetical protein
MNTAASFPCGASEREIEPAPRFPASNPDSFAGQMGVSKGALFGSGCQPDRGTRTAVTLLQRPAAGGSPALIQPQPLE